MSDPSQEQARLEEDLHREALSLLLVGGFFALLAVLVLLGTFSTWGNLKASTVNVVCGLLLLAIGLGMLGAGRWLRGRHAGPPARRS